MTIATALSEVIESWLSRKEARNLNTLSEKIGMPYATLRRYSNGEITTPGIEAILSIISVLSPEEQAEFLTEHHPRVARVFAADPERKVIAGTVTRVDRPDIDHLFIHRDGFLLGQHLLSRCGIREDKIQELYGVHGLELVKQLEDEGTAQYIDGVWRIPVEHFVSASPESSRLQVQHSASTFKPKGLEVGAAYIRTHSESVSIDGASQIRTVLIEASRKIDDITLKNPGKHVFVANVVTQLLDPEAAIKEVEEKEEKGAIK